MLSQIEKARLADKENYGLSDLFTVPKGKRPTQRNIVEAKQAIGKVLAGISNIIPNTGDYGYALLIYTPQEWLALGNALQVVTPTDPLLLEVMIWQQDMLMKHHGQHSWPINNTRMQPSA